MSKVIKRIYEAARENREEDGAAWISAKDVAALIRVRIKLAFPAVKFSVRKHGHDCVNISWTDGPCGSAVDAWLSQYEFGGFDGMIDMAYSSTNWLLPDGSMVSAGCSGTVGSMGTVNGYATDCPVPGAVLVKHGPKYIHSHHDHSDQRLRELCELVAHERGYTITDSPLYSQVVDGEYLTSLAYRLESEHAELDAACIR